MNCIIVVHNYIYQHQIAVLSTKRQWTIFDKCVVCHDSTSDAVWEAASQLSHDLNCVCIARDI